MVRPIQLLVNEHTKECCNIHSFNISTIYANCESIVHLFLLNTITFVFETFKESLFALNHVHNLSNSVDTVLHISAISPPVYMKFVSSANIIHFIICDTLHMSLIYRINQIGPNIEPYATPHAIFRQVEFVPLI